MIVDSSALVAIALDEPAAEQLLKAMRGHARQLRMSAATWVEAGIVLDARSLMAGRRLDDIANALGIEVVPVTAAMAQVARQAHRRFGRGSGSRARLNFGDCFSYALAITTGEPLLFVGEDFTHTDALSAL